MSERKDDQSASQDPPQNGSAAAGRVETDSRGRNVWRWAGDAAGSTSILLKRLDNEDLALEPTRKVPIMSAKGGKAMDAGGKPGSGSKSGFGSKSGSGSKTGVGAKADPGVKGKPLALSDTRKGGGGFDPYNSR